MHIVIISLSIGRWTFERKHKFTLGTFERQH